MTPPVGHAERLRRIRKVRLSSASKYASSVRTMVTIPRGNGRAEYDYARFAVRAVLDVESLDAAIAALESVATRSTPMTEPTPAPGTPPTREQPPPDIVAAALRAAAQSPCRSKRGAAIFTNTRLVVTGFNHRPDGCDGSALCKASCRVTAIHAEQDALLGVSVLAEGADMLHVKSVDGALVPSGPPSCVQCSKALLHAGIANMWLYHADGWKRYPAREFHWLSLAALPVAAPPAVTGWQPIESAPKDGTDVLLFWEAEYGQRFVRYWAVGRWLAFGDGSKGWVGESFRSDPDGNWTRILGERPTHWQPMLTAPALGGPNG